MITIQKSQAEFVKQVCQSAASRAPIQAYENVLIRTGDNAVEMKAGDQLIELTRIIDAEVQSGFETTVNAAKFLQSFNACAGDVTITVTDKMTIKSGKRRFTLPIISAESYPSYPEMEETKRIESPSMINDIKAASWASGVDDARHYLNGVYVGDHVVATNGHRLCIVESQPIETPVIIPIATVKRLPDFDGDVYVSDSIMCIKSDRATFKTKLVDGRFPDYKRVVPKCSKSASVNVSEFKDAIKAAQITANSQFKTVEIKFDKESTVSATSADKREDSLIGFECDTNEKISFAVNSSYLLDALNALSSDTVEIQFPDSLGQMMIDQDGIKSIISAVRV